MDVKYPDCEVQLSGTDGNVYRIFGKVKKALYRHLVANGMEPTEAEEESARFVDEAKEGDYDHVLRTCHRWVTVT